MLKFAHIEYLYALGLVPVLLLLFVLMMLWKKRALKRFGELPVIGTLMPEASDSGQIWKFILRTLALSFVIIALAAPQMGARLQEVKREGIDLMICLDVSNSMKAEDIKPNRLERSKRAISKLVDRLSGDRIGIIVFAGQAYVQLPITTDYAAAKMFLSTIDTDIVPTQGTSIGAAIELARESFDEVSKKNKAIVVITDGENHEDDAISAAKKAAKEGIIVHTIGMGTGKGAPIPLYNRYGKQVGFRQDKEGHTVVTQLNENMLQEIAETGEGSYIRATSAQTGLNILFDELSKLEKQEFESKIYTDYEDRFQYPLSLAIILLVISSVIGERKNRWFERMIMGNNK